MNRLRGHSKEKGFTPEDDQGEGMSEIAEEPRDGGYETPLVTVDMKLAAVKAYLKTVTRLGGKGTVNPVALVDAIDAALNVSASAHPILTGAWQSIETAPKDGTRFWGNVDDDAIAMLWHDGFGEFVSSWRRMEMAAGYTIDGAAYKDHSPVIHKPSHWMPLPSSLPEREQA